MREIAKYVRTRTYQDYRGRRTLHILSTTMTAGVCSKFDVAASTQLSVATPPLSLDRKSYKGRPSSR